MRKTALWTAAVIGASLMAGTAQAASTNSATAAAATPTVQTAADVTMVVSHSYAHLRKEPNTKSEIVATLKKGTKVTVIEKVENGKWAHVKTDKLEGYVAVSLLKAA